MTSVCITSPRPVHAPAVRAGARRGRDHQLPWVRNVRDGDEPPVKGLSPDLRGDPEQVAPDHGGPGGVSDPVPPDGRLRPVLHDPPEPDRKDGAGRTMPSPATSPTWPIRRPRSTARSTWPPPRRPGPQLYPRQDQLELDPRASYFYYCANNTIYGTEWDYVPETGGRAPGVRYVLQHPVRAGGRVPIRHPLRRGQKNMAPAGLTVVIIERSWRGTSSPTPP